MGRSLVMSNRRNRSGSFAPGRRRVGRSASTKSSVHAGASATARRPRGPSEPMAPKVTDDTRLL